MKKPLIYACGPSRESGNGNGFDYGYYGYGYKYGYRLVRSKLWDMIMSDSWTGKL